ncbi:MAG: helix-turn-helix domain-containing protein [Rikenellaceae bacterium]
MGKLSINDKSIDKKGTDNKSVTFCPIRDILSRVGDKWSMLVLMTIYHNNTIRFKELSREIPELSQKVLTSTLRNLESDGYVTRKMYVQIPPKVEYSLSELGHSLVPHLEGLVNWALDNGVGIINSRKAM